MPLERSDLVKGTDDVLTYIRRQWDSVVDGVEVSIFRKGHAIEWADHAQTARVGITEDACTSAKEIPSSVLTDTAALTREARCALKSFAALDPTINGLALSIFKRGDGGTLMRQSVAVGRAWRPPEPLSTVTEVAHKGSRRARTTGTTPAR